ncbi:hypothetical protein PAECIP111802_01950 [Paenibacillus allorhizosphaerae]|uniref:Uncharacterized protein n=1 Tax=Paenibacillus allorhizosphaerae TaxID=2849866 RepID=A0ABM8VF29_9BACL|nr:hypothetical protein PAECIP111802_01950 [Paenibacillus allorhizosphaerae]
MQLAGADQNDIPVAEGEHVLFHVNFKLPFQYVQHFHLLVVVPFIAKIFGLGQREDAGQSSLRILRKKAYKLTRIGNKNPPIYFLQLKL